MSIMAGDADLAPRPARPSDVKRVAALLAQAIDTSPFYGERFKQNEKRRLDERLLRTLIAIDPWHVALAWRDGEIAAIAITLPEFGTLWSPWIYVVPGGRSQALGLSMQQVQTYERGATRVSGRTLLKTAEALDCTVAWLVGEEETQDTPLMAQLMLPGADRLLEAYAALPNAALRTAVVKLVRTMAQPKSWTPDAPDDDE